MKASRLSLQLLLFACASIAPLATAARAQNKSGTESKQVKLLPDTVELVEVATKAEKCPNQKGTFVRLRVISDSPVDIRRFAGISRGWAFMDFPNRKKGDEITDYFCTVGAPFKFYSHPAGSSDAWPKP